MKKKILVVDDDPTMIKFLAPLFSAKNYESVNARDGNEALEKINAEPPDLIISDIMMPGMDGFELYRSLRQNSKTAQIPFIFLSSKDDPVNQLKGLRMGADEYLTKPFNATQLFFTIKTVFENVDRAKTSMERVDFSGNLAEISLEDIVQLIEMNQKTGELVFTAYDGAIIGTVFFKEGALINAVTDFLEGEEAFYDLSTHKNGYVKFFSKNIIVPALISSQTMAMLFEAARMHDEASALYTILKDTNIRLSIKSGKTPPDNKTPEAAFIHKICTMIQQDKTVHEIIHSGVMSRPRIENILVEMLNSKFVQVEVKLKVKEEEKIQKKVEKKIKSFPVWLVTDSSIDLPSEITRNRNVTVVPLNVHSGKQIFIDSIDFTPDRLYTLMETSDRNPRVFPVSYDEFHATFTDVVTEMDVLGIFMSRKLSLTYENAIKTVGHNYNQYSTQRTNKHGDTDKPQLKMIDSRLVSSGTGLMVLEALEKIESGWPINKIQTYIEDSIPKVRVLFFLNSSEYLNSNWRKGKVKILESMMRNRKPILSIGRGKDDIVMMDQVKSEEDALQLIERIIREDLLQYLGTTKIKAAVMHGKTHQFADRINTMIQDRFNCLSPIRQQVGSFVCAHCGPDVAGVAYFPVLEH